MDARSTFVDGVNEGKLEVPLGWWGSVAERKGAQSKVGGDCQKNHLVKM